MRLGRTMNQINYPITELLHAWQRGELGAADELMPLLYTELKKIAGAYLDKELDAPSLQRTELVNEAFIRLVDQRKIEYKDRFHFFGFAARVMPQLLIEHARKRKAQKRGGSEDELTLPDHIQPYQDGKSPDLIRLDEALDALEKVDQKKCRLVELKYFAGLTNEEIAKVMNISISSVKREWVIAKTWLYRNINRE